MISEDTLYKLGLTSRPAPTLINGMKFWADDGDIISFSLINRTFSNGLFEINNQNYWRLWWSQISQPMYNGNPNHFAVSSITFKDGRQKIIALLGLDDFLNQVRGRRFNVTAHTDVCLIPNKYNETVQRLKNYGPIYEFVHTRLMSRNFDEIKGMMKLQRRYTFTEI